MSVLTGIDLHLEVQRFLYHEAWLLDERRLYDWLDLLTDDVTYTLLVREKLQRKDATPATHAVPTRVLTVDDKSFLTLRVKRLDTGMAHAEKPASITRHLISNVYVADDRSDDLVARSSFMVYQARLETDDQTFYGKREDHLRRVSDGTLRLARRTVTLDHVTLPRTLTILF